MLVPNRHGSSNSYRYTFQGQEKDPETEMEAFQLRMWDGRLGRWLSPDPYGQYASPYLGMGNNPINSIDPDGGWEYRWQAWLHGLWDGKDGEIFESEIGDFGIKYSDTGRKGSGNGGDRTILDEVVMTIDFGGKRYDKNAPGFWDGVKDGFMNSMSFLKPNSGIIMYGNSNRRGDMDFGRSRGPGGEIYGTMDTQDLLTPGGFNGGGGTLLKQWLHLNNILPEATRGVKHVTSSLTNLNSLNEKLNGETIYDTVYYLHSFKNQTNRYEAFKGSQKTDSFVKYNPDFKVHSRNIFKRE